MWGLMFPKACRRLYAVTRAIARKCRRLKQLGEMVRERDWVWPGRLPPEQGNYCWTEKDTLKE